MQMSNCEGKAPGIPVLNLTEFPCFEENIFKQAACEVVLVQGGVLAFETFKIQQCERNGPNLLILDRNQFLPDSTTFAKAVHHP